MRAPAAQLARTPADATAIVWFRRDLRVHDHPALTAAHRDGRAGRAGVRARPAAARRRPLPVAQPRVVPARVPARAARRRCATAAGELFVRAGRPEDVLPRLARETGAEAVYFASDVSPFAMARDRRVDAALDGIARCAATPATSSPTSAGPRRATASRSPSSARSGARWEQLPRREVHGAPRALPCRPASPPAASPRPRSRRRPSRSRPARRAARERLSRWLADGIERYADRHDRLAGGTSRLSPYLHFGCVSAREVEAAGARQGRRGPGRVRAPARLARLLRPRPAAPPGQRAPRLQAGVRRARVGADDDALDAWREGRTGYPVVDAGMRQLPPRGLDAQPRAADRRLVPDEGPAPRLAARRGALHAPPARAATRRRTTATGSGSRRSASIPRRTSGASTTRPRSRSATTPTARTCAAGAPSWATCRSRSSPSRGR